MAGCEKTINELDVYAGPSRSIRGWVCAERSKAVKAGGADVIVTA